MCLPQLTLPQLAMNQTQGLGKVKGVGPLISLAVSVCHQFARSNIRVIHLVVLGLAGEVSLSCDPGHYTVNLQLEKYLLPKLT